MNDEDGLSIGQWLEVFVTTGALFAMIIGENVWIIILAIVVAFASMLTIRMLINQMPKVESTRKTHGPPPRNSDIPNRHADKLRQSLENYEELDSP